MKNIIESIRALRRQKRQCKELKALLMADYVTTTPTPNIYKVVFEDDFDGGDKYNLYDAKGKFYLFNSCKSNIQYLKYGLYFVREYDKSTGWVGGIFNVYSNWFVFAKRPSLKIKKFSNNKSDIVLLQTDDERIVFNLKTNLVERVISL